MRTLMACTIALLLTGAAVAQQRTYPEKAVRVVVPFPAGGAADALPRIVAERLRQIWNQPVVVENRAGAGGNIGASVVAAAEPDGYTLFSSPPGPFVINDSLYKQLSYNPTEFEPIVILAEVPSVLAVRKEFPAATVGELIAYAKANPGKINYASQGRGTISHLTAEMFQSTAGVKMTHVAYRGSAPALIDLAGGVVDLIFDNLASIHAMHNAGRVRIYAVASPDRVALLPDIPTLKELGLTDFQSVTWFAIAAPAKTPAPVLNRINETVAAILQEPAIAAQYQALGARPVGGSAAEMAKLIAAERIRWGAVIKSANITADE
ncbi:MAG TPA: tripartite tricarboxylate transporter substrate binding protein [Xanthobacteraceae bacterium]|jgi:tripartite-type tricarboxylate transporter receptor subunit TctC|nr:tripartite tricarboxylate transporter substrate binding protein [Xanthobacteraceae bacterium]